MDSYEFNKVVAAVLVSVLLIMFINMSAESLYHVNEPAIKAYVVEGLEEGNTDTNTVAAAAKPVGPTVAELMATADATKGARVFRKCQACHTASSGDGHKIGPNLAGVVDSDIARHGDFKYSKAMVGIDGAWTIDMLDTYLKKPAKAIPGNKMTFAGLKKTTDRANVIAYLQANN